MSTRLPNPSYNTVDFESKGSVILNTDAGGVYEGRFGAIQVLQDTTITSAEGLNIDNISGLNNRYIAAGVVIYGVFTKLTISTGLVALHKV